MKKNLIFLLPITVFCLLSIFLAVGLFLKPKVIPSALIGKPVPSFKLPAISEKLNGLNNLDLESGKPTWGDTILAEHTDGGKTIGKHVFGGNANRV